jgi:hypothetical protein
MKDILAVSGACIMLCCTIPYVIDIVKGKTKPNIVSWFTWTLLLGIGTAALYASHQTHAALLLGGDVVATFAVVLVGLKYGIAKLDLFDGLCQVGALVGLILWLVFNSPLIAITATIAIDFVGTIPSMRHCWLHPEEETSVTYTMGVIATILTLLSLKEYSITAWVYPVYLLFSNTLLVAAIMFGYRRAIRPVVSR